MIIVLVAGSAYILARSSLKQSVIDQLRLAVSLKEHEINQWFSLQIQDVFLLAQFPEIIAKTDRFINPPLDPSFEPDRVHEEIKNILNTITQVKSNIKIVSIVSNQGIVLISTNSVLERTYQPLGHLTTYITNPKDTINPIFYNSIITKNKAITLVTPIYKNNQKIAYLSIELDLAEVDNVIHKEEDFNNSRLYLIGRISGRNTFVNSLHLENEHENIQINSLAINSVLEGINGSGLYKNHQQIPVLGFYRWLEDKNMGLVAEIPQQTAFALAERLARQILLIGCLFLVIILTIIYIVTRKLVQPISQISKAAIKISQGDLNCHVPVLSKDEIGTLAMTFNVMTKKLNHSFQELETINEQLKIKVAQLKQANQRAEKANQVKSEFISQMSHELRTPLNSILGFSQVLVEDPGIAESQKSLLAQIYSSGYKLLELINDVISLSKKDDRDQSRCISAISVSEFLEELLSNFKTRFNRKNLSLVSQVSPQVPRFIQTDPYWLGKIFNYLLDNSIKFTEKGEIKIKVTRFEPEEDRKSIKFPDYFNPELSEIDWIQWEIEDTGCGIEPQELEHLFEPFSRHFKSGDFQEGMGLGLPMCKKLVRQMEGEIRVQSQVGRGTTVTVILPFQRASDGVEITLNMQTEEAEIISVSGGSLESLDNLRKSMESLSLSWLKKLYQACCEADDEQVIELLKEFPESESHSREQIRELAKNYRLDKILELVEPLALKE
ncbi:ATP-binding protein [Roseofilum sp. BLCC_M91]|uniref:histidine kinase n=1 Tax=Roseofilum halophilum BLCC-M91 TaxID=3022259 RepID=A0ABT7BKU3_9CYAN|nr:hybrid sensor histidine kinase/response regulator [Roseofilum halophilum]MDJ1179791.1 ATP-binding protein [Roseofilum halophilum BLCC-M91]